MALADLSAQGLALRLPRRLRVRRGEGRVGGRVAAARRPAQAVRGRQWRGPLRAGRQLQHHGQHHEGGHGQTRRPQVAAAGMSVSVHGSAL